MDKPVVGITTYLTRARFGSWEEDTALVPADYVRAITRAGGRALLVPPSEEAIEETLDSLDGVLFSGGADINPELYGQDALGGDLVQHLPEVVGDEKHKHTPGMYGDHDVMVEPETRLAALLGDRVPVKSHHHQGFGRLGAGLRESARAEDGTLEALEDPSRRFTLGVLWHPEAGEDMRLFEAFVEEARGYREERH